MMKDYEFEKLVDLAKAALKWEELLFDCARHEHYCTSDFCGSDLNGCAEGRAEIDLIKAIKSLGRWRAE